MPVREKVGFDSDKELVNAAVRTLECFFDDMDAIGTLTTPILLGSVVSVNELTEVLKGLGVPPECLEPEWVVVEREASGGKNIDPGGCLK
ncbi:hypothetical protein BC938DRAFT_472459 [Jimgerdemannia flammicorona]|uniref:Uncharacterized protein n=1 Tax=Jimgerdemannia flammicorona TaxID=994334 RepID=A0A433Q612_9FUNG|nr:hypothetical protein BC938DRAFT_472459 [Jimgerdemannia flammicorona]